jgi:NAD(P)H-flavin reductase/hemoglobin-like flavoprotein
VGLEDRESLRVVQSVFDGPFSDDVIRRFYATWFSRDPSVLELFPPDLTHQRQVFTLALRWLFGEFVAQRSAEPVAFLAQLGRDHRKYGVTDSQYRTLCQSMFLTLRTELGDRFTDAVDDATTDALTLIAGAMSGAAAADPQPAWWDGTVIECGQVSRDIAVVRLQLDAPMPYLAGQYVSVQMPQCPRRWRYLSPSMPSDEQGRIEFHVRAIPGGLVSPTVVAETRPGDRWRLSSPHGSLHIDRDGPDVLMVAGSTGLAPLRALLMDLMRFGENPRVHLFFGGRYPCELYDLQTLWEISACSPWLSVTPVAEHRTNPPWADEYPDPEPPRGLHVRQIGRLPEVVTGYGGWGDRQILICGRPEMVVATRAALIAEGAPAERIQHDPLLG